MLILVLFQCTKLSLYKVQQLFLNDVSFTISCERQVTPPSRDLPHHTPHVPPSHLPAGARLSHIHTNSLHTHFCQTLEQIELPAKLLDYFLRNINQSPVQESTYPRLNLLLLSSDLNHLSFGVHCADFHHLFGIILAVLFIVSTAPFRPIAHDVYKAAP